jgi:hypothetical protein
LGQPAVNGEKIYYREHYKYQITRPFVFQTGIIPPEDIVYPFFMLSTSGILYVRPGYAWDGASGPTWDSKSSMRPSLVHDCFCQMAADRKLDYATYAPQYNELFRKMCIADGMWPWRARIWKAGVIIGHGGDPEISDGNPERIAP